MVASHSPHRHRGGPTVVTRAHSKSPTKAFQLQSSPPACSSPFSTPNSPAAKITKPPASRKHTPLRYRTHSTSPIKFPLTLASKTKSELNTSSRKPSESPSEKHAMHRQTRAGIGVENGTPSPVKNGFMLGDGSPVGSLRQDEQAAVGRGSPVARKRQSYGSAKYGMSMGSSPLFSDTPQSPTKKVALKPPGSTTPSKSHLKKLQMGHLERPTFARARPQSRLAEFATPSDPASKIRRIASLENFQAPGSLPNASVHTHKPGSIARPRLSGLPAHLSTPDGGEWVTPQNYKSAKPNQAAFHSTGFVPKRGRLSLGPEIGSHHQQPDTPCKKATSFTVPAMSGTHSKGSKFLDFPSPVHGSKSKTGGFNLLRRKESMILTNDDSPSASFGDEEMSSGGEEYQLQPTPTKKVYGNLGPIFANVGGGIKRKGECKPQSPYSIGGRATRSRARDTPHIPVEPVISPEPVEMEDDPVQSLQAHNPLTENPTTPAKESKEFFARTDFVKSRRNKTPHNLLLDSTPNALSMSPHMTLSSKFSDVELIGNGEFSKVYSAVETTPQRLFDTFDDNSQNTQLASPRVSSPFGGSSPELVRNPRRYAIKKSKTRFGGAKDRDRRMEEVRVLRELGRHNHVLEFFDYWEEDKFLFIRTEFCEKGSLSGYLDEHGTRGRLDEFRVWKVLIEVCLGIKHIHACGFMHLDIKPSNVLIKADGTLKISDFGMATKWPAPAGIEREGDRQYIAPEVIQTNRYDKPVDIFSLGLAIIETAGNEGLPPNGPVWQSLRSGDLSGAPILSTSVSGELVLRDALGDPISTELLEGGPSTAIDSSYDMATFPGAQSNGLLSPSAPHRRRAFYRTSSGSKKLLHVPRPGDLVHPPPFMEDGGLERMVQWMLSPDPQQRPLASTLLERFEIKWVASRRKFPAMIFEGLWGPADGVEAMEDGFSIQAHPIQPVEKK
ncbi:hypothetical protein DFH27DRAFT_478924 [Peziza echinospora]|nr:hypothetical protein DFH27DRAFT_478924 [Peziza echinospora]